MKQLNIWQGKKNEMKNKQAVMLFVYKVKTKKRA